MLLKVQRVVHYKDEFSLIPWELLTTYFLIIKCGIRNQDIILPKTSTNMKTPNSPKHEKAKTKSLEPL
jgi:hypothetical protein